MNEQIKRLPAQKYFWSHSEVAVMVSLALVIGYFIGLLV